MLVGIVSAVLAAASAVAAMPPQTTGTLPAAMPVSSARLPAFPYLRWPGDFVPRGTPVEQQVGHFRFWDGTALEDVEGRTYLATLVRRDGGRPFDRDLLRRTIEAQLARMGAVRLAAGHVPPGTLDTINETDRRALLPGLGDIRHDPVETWTVRRRDRQIWVQYTDGAEQASIAVVATHPD